MKNTLKTILSVLLIFVFAFTLFACGNSSSKNREEENDATTRRSSEKKDEDNGSASSDETTGAAFEQASLNGSGTETEKETAAEEETQANTPSVQLKVGFIFLHDENANYDMNFIEAAKAACEKLSVPYVLKTNVDESNACYETCEDLVDQGCNLIFADSYGHESFMIESAKQHPDVQYCHASGVLAHTEGLANFHNAFAAVYEGRYLTGVAAGMKLNQLKDAGKLKSDIPKVGYVGTFTYEEIVSSYSAFFLGVRSVCPDAVMDVTFTGSWYDVGLEYDAANNLISRGCDLISQHSDSEGAPNACDAADVPNVGYSLNFYTNTERSNTSILSGGINWKPYFEYIITQVRNGAPIATDWTGTLKTGSIAISYINEAVAAPGTAQKLEQVSSALENGTLHVFDTSAFTVNGETLTSCMADVDFDYDYTADTEAVSNGYFHESEYRSAPYFNVEIDGIALIDRKY